MAGSPKKRARRAAAEAEAAKAKAAELTTEIPDAKPEMRTNRVKPPDARAQTCAVSPRPPPRARASTPRAAMSPGPELRATVDQLQAAELGKLAAILKPGIILTIERLRPHWCAGWVEDYPMQDGGLQELHEYISDEYGGNTYRVLVVSPDGQPYYETRLRISGPPRASGRLIDRDLWEGRQRADQTVAAPARNNGDSNSALISALGEMFRAVLDTTNRTADKTMDAVRSLNEAQQGQTTDLIKTIVESRDKTEAKASFAEQLKEVQAANEALKDVKDALTDPVPESDNEDNLINSALKGAATDFIKSVAVNRMTQAAGKKSAVRPRRERKPIDLRRSFPDPVSNAGRPKN